ncbi:4'-phosphopantetheinyl transferase [Paenibacillus uliginis N3/975]|uniref:4'-phosphopantetheinyl transferase n=1 Tax=Paenibacillus uliginis N3/975 TaxID=1313296 RepID=A0A1X7HFU4_9BACL|nr:4'-phosphopantetheinyl transferase superfamily protein [Paenibacillus uliginis]SMF85050.1 4'-phosphopantetheinyl transferase [Paenibacillus uliginis N3/975]
MPKAAAVKLPETMGMQEYDRSASFISAERRIQIDRFIRKEDANRSLFGELLARAMICRDLGVPNRDVHFVKNNYGKPLLFGHEEFHFNISHSGCWVVMIWDQNAVGIDIEQIQEIDLEIARRFFSPLENKDLISKPESERKEYFYDLWTLKESYIKALGTGLSTPLDSFSIRIKDNDKFMLDPDWESCRFTQFEIDPEYKLSVCSLGNHQPASIQIHDYKDLIDNLA